MVGLRFVSKFIFVYECPIVPAPQVEKTILPPTTFTLCQKPLDTVDP